MRILLMLLVLANFAFFAWQHWHARGPQELPAPRQETELGAGLKLVGEVVAQPTTRPAPVEEVPAPEPSPIEPPPADPGAGVACATLGPFGEEAVAAVARARLAELGYQPVMRESGGQLRSGFWVYLPPFESRNAAEEVEGELRARGVQDLFIVTADEQRNAISLGLFSTPERADQRAAAIGRLGYAPRVAERFRDATVYWLDFRERTDQRLEPEAIGVMAAGETLPEKREIPCTEIAEPAGRA